MRAEYADWQRVDYLRRETTRQADEILNLRLALARERYARLTAEIQLAIARGDEKTWAAKMAEREAA